VILVTIGAHTNDALTLTAARACVYCKLLCLKGKRSEEEEENAEEEEEEAALRLRLSRPPREVAEEEEEEEVKAAATKEVLGCLYAGSRSALNWWYVLRSIESPTNITRLPCVYVWLLHVCACLSFCERALCVCVSRRFAP